MKRRSEWWAAMILAVCLSGCYENTVRPTPEYSEPESLPVAQQLEAFPLKPSGFSLTWDYHDSVFAVVDGFIVERAAWADAVNDSFTVITPEPLQEREYADTEALPEGAYAYRVRSVSPAGIVGLASNVVRAVVDLVPPDPPIVEADVFWENGSPWIQVTWSRPEPRISHYEMFRTPFLAPGLPFIELPQEIFEDAAVGEGVIYQYWVVAVDFGLNRSVASNVVEVFIEPGTGGVDPR